MFEAILRDLEARVRQDVQAVDVAYAETRCHRAGPWAWIHAEAGAEGPSGEAMERACSWIGLAPEPPAAAAIADLDAWAMAVFPFRRRVPADRGPSRAEGVRVLAVTDTGLAFVAIGPELDLTAPDLTACGHGTDVVERTLALDPDDTSDPEATERFIDVLVEQDRWAQAALRLERLVALRPSDDANPTDRVWRLAKLCTVRAQLGQMDGATSAAREALDLGSTVWTPRHRLVALVAESAADAFEAAGRLGDALPWLQRAAGIYEGAGLAPDAARLEERLARARGAPSPVGEPGR